MEVPIPAHAHSESKCDPKPKSSRDANLLVIRSSKETKVTKECEQKGSPSIINGPISSKDRRKKNKDPYCWRCHEIIYDEISCSICPRSYHNKCLKTKPPESSLWACPQCVTVMNAENIDSRSLAMQGITGSKLSKLLIFVLNHLMNIPEVDTFTEQINVADHPEYFEYIVEPMYLNKIRDKIKQEAYGSTIAFLMDCRWILHNSIIYNTVQAKVTNVAKLIVNMCKQEIKEIELCPQCYENMNTMNENWFTDVCDTPHILLWVKVKGFPFWPAKGMSWSNGRVEVKFFGAHDRSSVFLKDCYLYSTQQPNASHKPKKSGELLQIALNELEMHISNIKKMFGDFVPAPFKSRFEPENHKAQLELMIPTLNDTKPNFDIEKTDTSQTSQITPPKIPANRMQPVIFLYRQIVEPSLTKNIQNDNGKSIHTSISNIEDNSKTSPPLTTSKLKENKIITNEENHGKRKYSTDENNIFCGSSPEKSKKPNHTSDNLTESLDTLYNLALRNRKNKLENNKNLKTYSRKEQNRKCSNFQTQNNSKITNILASDEKNEISITELNDTTKHIDSIENTSVEADNISYPNSVNMSTVTPKIIDVRSLALMPPNKISKNDDLQNNKSNATNFQKIFPARSDTLKSKNEGMDSVDINKTIRNIINKPEISFNYVENKTKPIRNENSGTTILLAEKNPALPNQTKNNNIRIIGNVEICTENKSPDVCLNSTFTPNSTSSQINDQQLDYITPCDNLNLNSLRDKANHIFDCLDKKKSPESSQKKIIENIFGLLDNLFNIVSDSALSSSNNETWKTEFDKLKFKCEQENLEMRHNTGLIIAEMRYNLELEKERALKQVQSRINIEKMRAIADVKSKRWCTYCKIEIKNQCCKKILHCNSQPCQQAYQKHQEALLEFNSMETTT